MSGLPFKPGDWTADDSARVAYVRSVYEDRGAILFDLVMYDRDGKKVGRVSPSMGGPRTFEPACSIQGWRRIAKPAFPLTMVWQSNGKGKQTPVWQTGKTLPPADWTPKPRRVCTSSVVDDRLVQALRKIADGHNDPRALANEVLGQKP